MMIVSFAKSMNSLFLLIAGALLFTACSSTKSSREAPGELQNALLWKIEHEDQTGPSYLFGTIHMIPQEDYFLPDGLEEAFAKTDDVVFEIDMDDMSGIGSLMSMLTNLLMKDGMTLNKLLSKEEYAEVSEYFENMGLPMMLLNKVKPMFLSMLAEINIDPGSMQSEDIVSYEMKLYEKAQSMEKEVSGLETMKYQMSLFDSIPYRTQAVMLLDAVRGTNLESDLFEQTVALYKLQDIEEMVKMVGSDPSAAESNFESVLLHNRNQNWIPVMAQMMKEGPVFFAVGAGHLGGDQGVIRLLQKQGYTLTPMSVTKPGPARQRV